MTTMKVRIRFGDRLRSKRGSARHCLIATAATRQWGGEWNALPHSVERVSDTGQAMRWRPSLGAYLVMFLFDAGLPVPVRSVKLVRGRKGTPKASKPHDRVRKARQVAAGTAASSVLLLAVDGLEWVVYAIVGALIAAAAVVTTVKVRQHRRAGVLAPGPVRPAGGRGTPQPRQRTPVPDGIGTPQPATPALPIAWPERPQPEHEHEPVQLAKPKARPVISEPSPEVVQEVVNART